MGMKTVFIGWTHARREGPYKDSVHWPLQLYTRRRDVLRGFAERQLYRAVKVSVRVELLAPRRKKAVIKP